MTDFWKDPDLPVYDKSMDLKQMKKDMKEAEPSKAAANV